MARRQWARGTGWMVAAAAMLIGLVSTPLAAQDTSAVKRMPADAVPQFDVATIKPTEPDTKNKGFMNNGRHVLAVNMTVNDIVSFAYGVHAKQIAGAPAWLGTDRFDVDGVPDVEGELNLKQMQGMYRKLLADRFNLTFHREKRELAVYAVTVAKGGPKLTKSKGAPDGSPDQTFTELSSQRVVLRETNATMEEFALMLVDVMDRPVVDQTGIAGRFDFTLKWTPDETQFGSQGVHFSPPGDDPNAAPGLFTAIQEQAGLKLEPVKAQTDVIVIDHVGRSSAN